MIQSLEVLKYNLEKNAGGTGVKIFRTSVARLKIKDPPTNEELVKLSFEIEKKLKIVFGNIRGKEILDKLDENSGQIRADYESEIKLALENQFRKRGIPGEANLKEIMRSIVSKGFRGDEKKAIEILKQLSKNKILLALNYCMTRFEIQCFIEKYPSYTQVEFVNFINYLRNKKFESNDDIIINLIEKERLCRKFDDNTLEDAWQEKISKQYISLFNSTNNSEYKYLMADEELTNLLLKTISKVAFAKL